MTDGQVRSSTAAQASASPAMSSGRQPRAPKFDDATLRTYMRKLLESLLEHARFDDKEETRRLNREVCNRVKDRMVEIGPRGFKYIVTMQTFENLGQGGRADMVTRWGEDDAAVQEVYSNAYIQVLVIAFIVRRD